MTRPLISVVVAVYNTSAYLDRCVQSLLAQTYKKLEIILVDDGSTDQSPEICDRYASQYTHIHVIHQQNLGLSVARNRGIQKAQGEFVGFVDSDDYCAPQMYETLYGLIERYGTQVAAANYYMQTHNSCRFSPLGMKEGVLRGEEAVISCVQKLASLACNKLFARILFDAIKFPPGKLFEDLAVCYRLYDKAGGVAVADTPVYYYNRTNPSSITLGRFSLRKLDYLQASSELLAFCRSKKYYRAEKIVLQKRIWHITGFLRQMAACNFNDKAVIRPLLEELKKHLGLYLTSSHKLTSKAFAVACCINFNWTARLYRLLFQRGEK